MPQVGEGNGFRVLTVEDDPLMLELITTRLAIAGYRTFQARDGQEGLNVLKDVAPHALILDINMPRLDGFGMLRHMRNLGYLLRIPTLVLTARNQADDVRQAISLGASDFLAKPFDDQRLLSRVARLIRTKGVKANGATWT